MPARLAPDTLHRILDAVDVLLARLGYRKMTVERVAQEAGIGKGSVYLYFPSKGELVLASIDRIVDRLLGRLEEIAGQPAPPAARLRRMLVARVMVRFDGAQQHTRSLDEILAAVRTELLARRVRYFATEAAVLRRVLEEGVALGELVADDLRASAETLVLATNALLPYSLSARELGRRAAIARKATRLADLLVRGLVANAPPQPRRLP